MISQLIEYAETNARGPYAKFAWVARGMSDEMMQELVDVPEEKLEQWFSDFGQVIEWCGSGDPSVLPESVRDFIRSRFPSELPAIEAGSRV